MHKLVRQVRFSVNPFLSEDKLGFNSFSSNPPGEGLAIYFGLWVELTGDIQQATGFVVNVVDIDKCVRKNVVPIFAKKIRQNFKEQKHMDFCGLTELLKLSYQKLTDKFGAAKVSKLTLELNPFKKISVDSEDSDVVYFSEKFESAATHKLWNDELTEKENFAAFGACANPTGHGHNYVVEVTANMLASKGLCVGELEKAVKDSLLNLVDHKNLNVDVEEFGKINPTVENIAVFAWKKLVDKLGQGQLHCVTIWETEKTYCSYYG